MLGKRDAIFWWATSIFVVSLALAITRGQEFLLLMIASYLLRPTVHSLGFAKSLIDERQLDIHYRASNVGFAAMVIGVCIVTMVLMAKNDHTWEMLAGVLAFGLAARAVAGLLLVGDPLVAGQRALFGIGFLVAVFAAMDAGFPGILVAVLPGVLIGALGLIAPRYPRAVAGGVATCAAFFGVAILAKAFQQSNGPIWGFFVAFVFIVSPLLIAATLLWRGAAPSDDTDTAFPASSLGAER